MPLFDGVEGFTPAFTGQEIANQTGSGAAQAFSSGYSAANKGSSGGGKSDMKSNFISAQATDSTKLFDHAGQFGVFSGGNGMGM